MTRFSAKIYRLAFFILIEGLIRYTDFSIHRGFCTKIIWQRETCTHRKCDHTHTLLTQHTRTHKGIEKQRCFADKDILNSNVLHRKTSLFCCSLAFQGDAFTRRQTKLFSHTKAFTRTGFHTNPVSPIFLAHREEFVHENGCLGPILLHATAFPHRRFFAWTHSMLLLDEMLRSSDLVLNPSATILVFKKRKPILAIKILETLTVKYRTPGCLFGCLLGLQKLLLFLHFHPTSGPPHMPWNFFCVLWGWVSAVFFLWGSIIRLSHLHFFLDQFWFSRRVYSMTRLSAKIYRLAFFILIEGLIRWNLEEKKRLSLVQELTTGHTKFSHTHTQTHFSHTQLFWIQIALQTGGCKTLCTQALLYTDFSIHRGFCTKIVWQRETCTHRRCEHTHCWHNTHEHTKALKK